MKYFTAVLLFMFSAGLFAQGMTLGEWNEQAKTNIRLLPKYGNAEKLPEQKEADEKFINEMMLPEKFNGDRAAASAHMIRLGFNYLYRGDIKTAMYRFNQAYLLDPENTDIFWGYGVVYMVLGDSERGLQQYDEGLKSNPKNTNILTDYGTYYIGQYSEDKKNSQLDKALEYLLKSYSYDKTNPHTLFKLSVVYMLKDDCTKALDFYEQCKAIESNPMTEEFVAELLERCARN